MASVWGNAWGAAWGNAWGTIAEPEPPFPGLAFDFLAYGPIAIADMEVEPTGPVVVTLPGLAFDFLAFVPVALPDMGVNPADPAALAFEHLAFDFLALGPGTVTYVAPERPAARVIAPKVQGRPMGEWGV